MASRAAGRVDEARDASSRFGALSAGRITSLAETTFAARTDTAIGALLDAVYSPISGSNQLIESGGISVMPSCKGRMVALKTFVPFSTTPVDGSSGCESPKRLSP